MAGAVGFGSGPDDRGPAGVDVPEPIGSPEDQFINDIHQIKRKYVDGGTNLKVALGLAANAGVKQDMTGLGLTCSACHTGRFTYKDTAVIIDGGPALTSLKKLKSGMGVSLLLTRRHAKRDCHGRNTGFRLVSITDD